MSANKKTQRFEMKLSARAAGQLTELAAYKNLSKGEIVRRVIDLAIRNPRLLENAPINKVLEESGVANG
jgi:hypothetical protein